MKNKTYSKPVFAGKEIPFIGMDQGKGDMYQGLGTRYCFNLYFDTVMLLREGQSLDTSYAGTILSGGLTDTVSFRHESTNIWIEVANG
jgi:hypothetical protein